MGIQLSRYKLLVASKEHIDWLVDVAAFNMIHDELCKPSLWDRHSILQIVELGISSKTVFIVEEDGGAIGAILGILNPHPFNRNVVTLTELMWYVDRDKRKSRCAALLLNAFTAKGEELNVATTLSLLTGSNININSLQRKGYLLEELSFSKNLGD